MSERFVNKVLIDDVIDASVRSLHEKHLGGDRERHPTVLVGSRLWVSPTSVELHSFNKDILPQRLQEAPVLQTLDWADNNDNFDSRPVN